MARNDPPSRSPAPSGGLGFTVTPMTIQQKEFHVSRFGGYRMRDVDVFLDEVTEAVAAMHSEIERLRADAGTRPVLGSPDLDAVSRQADEIIARAREEAALIAATAHASAAESVTLDPMQRDEVRTFLTQERAFLQDLATLVQAHAESVKAMAKASKRPEQPAETETEPEPEPLGTEIAEPDPSPEATIRLEEPVIAEGGPSEGQAEPDPPPDESLRELFWGGGEKEEVTPSEG